MVASPLHSIVGKYFEIKLKREQTWRGTECVWACVCVHTLRLHLNIHFLLSHKCRCVGRIRSNFDWNCLCAIGIGKTIDEMTLLVCHKTVFVIRLCLCLNGTKENHEMFFIVFLFLPNLKLVQLGLMAKRTNCCHFIQYSFISIEYTCNRKGKGKKGKEKQRIVPNGIRSLSLTVWLCVCSEREFS